MSGIKNAQRRLQDGGPLGPEAETAIISSVLNASCSRLVLLEKQAKLGGGEAMNTELLEKEPEAEVQVVVVRFGDEVLFVVHMVSIGG